MPFIDLVGILLRDGTLYFVLLLHHLGLEEGIFSPVSKLSHNVGLFPISLLVGTSLIIIDLALFLVLR